MKGGALSERVAHSRALADRFRSLAYSLLNEDARELVDEGIDEVGEYGLAARLCASAMQRAGTFIPPEMLEQADKLGFNIKVPV